MWCEWGMVWLADQLVISALSAAVPICVGSICASGRFVCRVDLCVLVGFVGVVLLLLLSGENAFFLTQSLTPGTPTTTTTESPGDS